MGQSYYSPHTEERDDLTKMKDKKLHKKYPNITQEDRASASFSRFSIETGTHQVELVQTIKDDLLRKLRLKRKKPKNECDNVLC